MAVGFSTDVEFGVVPDGDGRLPMPTPDDTGLRTYAASIILEDRSEYNKLLAYHSAVAIIPAMGGGGIVTLERGRGARTLIYPAAGGDEDTVNAILTQVSGRARMGADSHWAADVTFVIVAST